MMRKWFERVVLPISMIGGYGLMAGICFLIALLFGYVLAELISRTIIEPSILVVAADIFVIGSLGFFLTREKVRTAFAEAWKQLMRNL